MSEVIIVNSTASASSAMTLISELFQQYRYLEIEIKHKGGRRTSLQNNSLHLFLTQLAAELNAAGYDMRKTLKPGVEIPWTTVSAKEHLWRPIQEALTGKESTTEITTVEPTIIHETLSRHLGAKLGVICPPWPSRENRGVA